MITKDNLAELLRNFEFSEKNHVFKKEIKMEQVLK